MSEFERRLRARLETLPTPQLLRMCVVESQRLRPEALEIWREELAARGQEIETEIRSCVRTAGEVLGTVQATLSHRPAIGGHAAIGGPGELIFTTNGLGFRGSTANANDPLAHALLGPVLGRFSDRMGDPANRIVEPGDTGLPVTLVAKLYDSALWLDGEQLRSVCVVGNNSVVCDVSEGPRLRAAVGTQSMQSPLVERWANGLNIPFTSREPGLTRAWKRLLGRR